MKRYNVGLAIPIAVLLLAPPPACRAVDPGKPNILLIVADDMGFSDAACYGGEIATPHLDQLAKNGLRFSQFYNMARCWPSRAAIHQTPLQSHSVLPTSDLRPLPFSVFGL